jgi:monooxygenase
MGVRAQVRSGGAGSAIRIIQRSSFARVEHFDVIIVGAGISGIGVAHHLQEKCPKKTFTILEGRGAIGGTWDLFRYPGVRSDSDMHTLGYLFKPWREAKAIADGPSILKYVVETAHEDGLVERVRFKHNVVSAAWSSDEVRWTLDVEGPDETNRIQFTCNFLSMCGGYYSYREAVTPDFAGMSDFGGQVVHPQRWPEELDYSGKRVIVIGSGATAMTLVPAMADTAEHVTMVQRSPTYVVSAPAEDRLANLLRKLLPEKIAYAITRWKNVYRDAYFYHRTRVAPAKVKKQLLDGVRAALGPDFDVDAHFNPSYNPWDQRLCLIPDDDLYKALRARKASVVTDHIDHVTHKGLALASGRQLEADIIVTATGLKLVVLSEVRFSVDGEKVNFADTFTYKGMMFSGVPNLLQTFGYINASWTLRVDLNADYICRLLRHMDSRGMRQATPRLRDEDKSMPTRDWIDDFSAGYMQRLMHLFPKQGDRWPWLNSQNYQKDRKMILRAPVEDSALQFTNPAADSNGRCVASKDAA